MPLSEKIKQEVRDAKAKGYKLWYGSKASGMVFTSKAKLDAHLRKKKPNRCANCDKGFEYSSYLKKHLKLCSLR
ncbi:hypothetical protein B484DRAFT_409851 [Ochromonadaceae sp. CCMP2298]|nr:hypothetical protein B484DRAFT_409851 [Ochromonadaceae sp. CCMP2298]